MVQASPLRPAHGGATAYDVAASFSTPTLNPDNISMPSRQDQAGTAEEESVSSTKPSGLPIANYLRKEDLEQWAAVARRTGPLTLLELPFDILRLIVKETTHTNDLTSLALTNSTLHSLAIPHIYARFDIVWPDAHVSASESKSVDALTYGLSTLALGSRFARTMKRLAHRRRYGGNGSGGDDDDNNNNKGSIGASTTSDLQMSSVADDYAQYTRKFSLGNGPADWVAEYMISKESGKMLGTLVALAVARMCNLEAFVWDMPTGVLSDIFMALAGLPDLHPDGRCLLERAWVRWHDNSYDDGAVRSNSGPAAAAAAAAPPPHNVVPQGSTLTHIGYRLPSHVKHSEPPNAILYSESNVEYPTFSVLPPLKSLTVLDIDELSYLDEIAVLIESSKGKLKELRLGVSSKAVHKAFVQTWDGEDLHQVDHNAKWPGDSTIRNTRLGGVLGVIVGRIYDIRRKPASRGREKSVTAPVSSGPANANVSESTLPSSEMQALSLNSPTQGHAAELATGNTIVTSVNGLDPNPNNSVSKQNSIHTSVRETAVPHTPALEERKRLDGKLQLQTLELERIPLSIQVCSRAIDWTVLTNLTLLECAHHEQLWKQLKKQFAPTTTSTAAAAGAGGGGPALPTSKQYHPLALRRLHTDMTSPALVAFLRETLAPNSLEVLFLQDRRRGSGPPPVRIDHIFRGAVRRHRGSLRKLLLDSAGRAGPESSRWRNWVLPSEMLLYVTSGRMANLRELAVSLDYKDWHTFLQRLPNMPNLRSLNIPHIMDHQVLPSEPRELALQMVDIVTLRPEIQLCYVGLSTKCFEILEVPVSAPTATSAPADGGLQDVAHDDDEDGLMDDEDEDEDDEDDDETEDEDEMTDEEDELGGGDEGDEDLSEDDADDAPLGNGRGVPSARTRLRLREILFYDDKVAIFKARHARL